MMGLSLQDFLTVISTVAAVVAAVYAVIAYHRPPTPVPAERPQANPAATRKRGRQSIVPIIAALVAWAAVAVGFYERHWAARPILTTMQEGMQGEPMGWSRIYINNTTIYPSSYAGKTLPITSINVFGSNLGKEEIKLDDVYFISGISGTRLNAKVSWGGTRYQAKDLNPVPPNAFVFVASDPIGPNGQGLPEEEFLNAWSIIYLVAEYNGTKHRISFDAASVRSALPKPSEPAPHISPRKWP